MSDFSITIPRGDSFTLKLELHRPRGGAILQLQGTELIWCTAKLRESDTDDDAVFQKGVNVAGLDGVVITDGPNGLVEVRGVPADTEELTATLTKLLVDVQLVEGSGTVTTVARGVLNVTADITRSDS